MTRAEALPFPKMSERVGLTQAQEAAIGALAAGKSLAGAATVAGVTPRTVYRWRTQDDTFISALRSARDAAFASTLDELRRVSGVAVSTCEALMKARNRPEVRLRAAATIMPLALKANEAVCVEERLRAIEERLAR